jgi:hypothetical protein
MGVLIYKNDPLNPGVYRTTFNQSLTQERGKFIEENIPKLTEIARHTVRDIHPMVFTLFLQFFNIPRTT